MEIKYYIIIFDKELVGNQVFNDRIHRLGENSFLFEGAVVLLKSSSSASDIYRNLAATPFDTKPMLVMSVSKTEYSGFMESNLWGWLKAQQQQ